MRYYIVSVRDRKTSAYMTPVAVVSLPQAQRSFLKEIEKGGQFESMSSDVELYLVAEMDEETGQVFPDATLPRMLAAGS